jgi:hypothetical protein
MKAEQTMLHCADFPQLTSSGHLLEEVTRQVFHAADSFEQLYNFRPFRWTRDRFYVFRDRATPRVRFKQNDLSASTHDDQAPSKKPDAPPLLPPSFPCAPDSPMKQRAASV